ncbi:YbaB/EbfC family nucleoid-associated protein [Thermomonospora umbrina]|uniref:YbaB/EbfC DNA-binding family protein n=1 Tax=Thermomonospora umbrina TaxID=111806 RepID=A0A3D9SMA5_9ACTN|nr:YbaB/EbfC family nucleoid-associated protein [Thermomonospora umbrina]REE96978.1 YbaB/EbfC DNA-binding family protein [Thermomonospora umbrina]
MGGANPHDEARKVREHLDRLLESVRTASEQAREERIHAHDDDGIVTIVANGDGDVLDLRIKAATRTNPRQLGARISTAVSRARGAAAANLETALRSALPTSPAGEEIARLTDLSGTAPNPDHLDHDGSPITRAAIAQSMEAIHRAAAKGVQRAGEQLHHEIGAGAGTVTINVSGTEIAVEIERDAPGNLGVDRLAGQVLSALRKAISDAAERRVIAARELQSDEYR